MFKRIFSISGIVFFLFLCVSCEKGILQKREKLLTSQTWQLSSLVDLSTNSVIEVEFYTYTFYLDGTFLKITEQDEFISNWKFFENQTEILITNNTYKVENLTNTILRLRYGELEFLYIHL
jgi:hypothetical protein